jgi:4-aminobutyrate aminotransferase-like enzyme
MQIARAALLGQGHPCVREAVLRLFRHPEAGPEVMEELIRRLTARVPESLSACYFLNSLSEANELALRLARARVSGKDVIVLDGADHGMTTSLKNMSPARGEVKFWAHVARRGDADHVASTARAIQATGRGLCAFFAEGVFPDGFLRRAYQAVRSAGGVCVAIEEQTGLGRVGASFWEFTRQGAMPDIVVVGQSLANGLPLAAVVTREELAAFPPTQAHPAMCAAGLAVLDAIEREQLAERADRVGAPLAAVAARGAGLCWEIDHPDGSRTVIRPPLVVTEAEVAALARAHRQPIPAR